MGGLNGYRIDVAAYRGQLGTLKTELDEVETANSALETAVEGAKTAVKGTIIPGALDNLNLTVLKANAEAAHQRGTNAHKGASLIADAYIAGDEAMEDRARAQIDATPDFHERD